MYIRAKKANSTGGGNLAQAGGGDFGLKQLSMLDSLRNRWTRGERDLIHFHVHVCIMPKIILGMKRAMAVHI